MLGNMIEKSPTYPAQYFYDTSQDEDPSGGCIHTSKQPLISAAAAAAVEASSKNEKILDIET